MDEIPGNRKLDPKTQAENMARIIPKHFSFGDEKYYYLIYSDLAVFCIPSDFFRINITFFHYIQDAKVKVLRAAGLVEKIHWEMRCENEPGALTVSLRNTMAELEQVFDETKCFFVCDN